MNLTTISRCKTTWDFYRIVLELFLLPSKRPDSTEILIVRLDYLCRDISFLLRHSTLGMHSDLKPNHE